MALQLATIRVTYDEAMEISPPDSMAHIHYKYIQALKHFHTMTQLLADGIDNVDADLLSEGLEELNIGRDYIEETTALINEFNAEHGIE
jgi:hypothetical protein